MCYRQKQNKMTTRKKHIEYILNHITDTIDDLVKLAQMDDYEIQHEYLKLKYGQNDK